MGGGGGGAHIHPQTHITEHIIAEYICISHSPKMKARGDGAEVNWTGP